MLEPVAATADFHRVLTLPRKPLQPVDVAGWTRALLRENAPIAHPAPSLFPVQAQALQEAHRVGGLFGILRVGAGKTLLSGLLPTVMQAARPLLVVPAALVDKTIKELSEYARTWKVHPTLTIRSYQTLGRTGAADSLELIQPDVLLLDESHNAKNTDAAVTRRIARYVKSAPAVRVCAFTGTPAKEGLCDFAHVLIWCLRNLAPVPLTRGELIEWSEALDDFPPSQMRRPLGALSRFASPASFDLAQVRRGFRTHLHNSPGIVATDEPELQIPITINTFVHHVGAPTLAAFDLLRKEKRAIDGWAFGDAMQVWAHARQLSQGFAYVHDPRPAPEWVEARSEWTKACAIVLQRSRSLDSEKQVKLAVESGKLPHLQFVLGRWLEAERTFKLKQKIVWLDSAMLDMCHRWIWEHRGLVWVEHTAFGQALAERAGVPYFGEKGKDRYGMSIEAYPGGPAVLSVRANSTGRNLQDRWHRSLIPTPPTNGKDWQQLIGRFHRPRFAFGEVILDVAIACAEHENAMNRSDDGAHMQADMLGDSHKLLHATIHPWGATPRTSAFQATPKD